MGRLYFGDNLDILREHIQDESVDLIYLDPPFHLPALRRLPQTPDSDHRRLARRDRNAELPRSLAGRGELQKGAAGKASRRTTAVILKRVWPNPGRSPDDEKDFSQQIQRNLTNIFPFNPFNPLRLFTEKV